MEVGTKQREIASLSCTGHMASDQIPSCRDLPRDLNQMMMTKERGPDVGELSTSVRRVISPDRLAICRQMLVSRGRTPASVPLSPASPRSDTVTSWDAAQTTMLSKKHKYELLWNIWCFSLFESEENILFLIRKWKQVFVCLVMKSRNKKVLTYVTQTKNRNTDLPFVKADMPVKLIEKKTWQSFLIMDLV